MPTKTGLSSSAEFFHLSRSHREEVHGPEHHGMSFDKRVPVVVRAVRARLDTFNHADCRKSLAGNDDGISRRGTLIGLSSFIDYFDSASFLRASRSRSTRGVSAWSTAHWG